MNLEIIIPLKMKKLLFTITISLIVFSASAQKNDSLKITNEVAIVLTDIINGTYQINTSLDATSIPTPPRSVTYKFKAKDGLGLCFL